MIHETTAIVLTCDSCGKKSNITNARNRTEALARSHFRLDRTGDGKVKCPSCYKKWIAEQKKSLNIHDRIGAGAYDTNKPGDHDRFKLDALIHVRLSKHPKRDKIFHRAWESGHSSGFDEVLCCLSDLAEIFEDELDT